MTLQLRFGLRSESDLHPGAVRTFGEVQHPATAIAYDTTPDGFHAKLRYQSIISDMT